MPERSGPSSKEVCEALRARLLWQGKRAPHREIKLKVLDHLIRLALPDDRFESLLRSRLAG